MIILMYNNSANRMESYSRELYESMPYNVGRTLTVGEFRAKSTSEVIWSSVATMTAWNNTRSIWGQPISVGYAFRRIGEGGHSNQSQHYAGTAFDVGQNLSQANRNYLWWTASDSGQWTYVEPQSLTPTWVHFDKRAQPPACLSGGYPLQRRGMLGNYVCVLQDALATVGIPGVSVDGVFGPVTETAVKRFQRENSLTADGIAGCYTWTSLTAQANNKFRSSALIPVKYNT